MKNSVELLLLGNQLSKAYVEKNEDMTTALEKVATEHGLNAQEISRVAEQANTETYLALLSKSKDHYVEFPLAKASEVHEKIAGLSKTAELDVSSDDEYQDLNYPTSRIPAFEKVAEEPVIETGDPNDRGLIDYAEFLTNELGVQQAKLAKSLDRPYHLEKQALFHNTPSELAHTINSVSEDVFEIVEKEHFPKFAEIFYDKDFTKFAELGDVTVQENELVDAVKKAAHDIESVKIVMQEEVNIMEKLAGIGGFLKAIGSRAWKGVKGTYEFSKKYPRVSTGLVVGGVSVPVAYSAGKQVQKSKSNPMGPEQEELVQEILKQRRMRLV